MLSAAKAGAVAAHESPALGGRLAEEFPVREKETAARPRVIILSSISTYSYFLQKLQCPVSLT